MTRNNRRIIAALSAVALLFATGAWHLLLPLHRDPPKIMGADNGAGDQPTRKIILERSYRVTGWLPDPEGGHNTLVEYRHFFLETSGAPRMELKFLSSLLPVPKFSSNPCYPVHNTQLWVAVGFWRPGPQIDLIVFDQNGLRTQRTIPVAVDWSDGLHDYWLEDGNAKIRFRSTYGVGTYDVISDTLTQ